MKQKDERYWSCIIGPVDIKNLGGGEDATLRMPVRDAFNERFGEDKVCSSGWGITKERYELLRYLNSLDTEVLKKIVDNNSGIKHKLK